jgi:hypothetical protein
MSEVEDVLAFAWSKDSASLKSAIDDIMTSKASSAIDNMKVDVASSIFGNYGSDQAMEDTSDDDSHVETQNDHDEGTENGIEN